MPQSQTMRPIQFGAAATSPGQSAMKKTPFLLISLVTAIALVGAVFLLGEPVRRWQTARWQQELDAATSDQIPVLLDKMDRLGDVGIPVLVRALGSSRRHVAWGAQRRLSAKLRHWETLHARDASRHLAALAAALAENVEMLDPDRRHEAAEWATRILRRPLDQRMVDCAEVIASCERVIRAAGIGDTVAVLSASPAAVEQEESVDMPSRPSQADRSTTSLLDVVGLADLPGGNLAPQTSGDDKARVVDEATLVLPSPRWFTQPEAADPSPRLLADGDLESVPLAETVEAAKSTKHDVFEALRLESIEPSPQVEAVDTTAHATETLVLIRELRSADAAVVARARDELARRGFTEVHFELGRQLFDPRPEVRHRLLATLPKLRSVDAEPWLLWLAQDTDAGVRAAVISYLATGNDPGLLEKIERIARSDSDNRVRNLAERIARRRAEMQF